MAMIGSNCNLVWYDSDVCSGSTILSGLRVQVSTTFFHHKLVHPFCSLFCSLLPVVLISILDIGQLLVKCISFHWWTLYRLLAIKLLIILMWWAKTGQNCLNSYYFILFYVLYNVHVMTGKQSCIMAQLFVHIVYCWFISNK